MAYIYDLAVNFLGQLAIAAGSVAGIAALVWFFFKKFGEKWLDQRFATRLEAYKHSQQRELEDLRFKISTQLDRLTKLHQFEFEALPEAWKRIVKAYYSTASLVSQFQSTPNLDRMNASQLEEFLTTSPLTDREKDELRATDEKTEYLRKTLIWINISDCRKNYFSAREYVTENGIFIPAEITAKFDAICIAMWRALREHQMLEGKWERDNPAREKFNNDTDMITNLEALVRSHLWSITRDKNERTDG